MSQRGVILRLLNERGEEGVSAHELTYRYGITRAAAIVFELRDEGMNIVTIDDGDLPDGRRRMARYVLHKGPATHAERREPTTEPIPQESKELALPCGCRRAADGLGWVERCERHAAPVGAAPLTGDAVPEGSAR